MLQAPVVRPFLRPDIERGMTSFPFASCIPVEKASITSLITS